MLAQSRATGKPASQYGKITAMSSATGSSGGTTPQTSGAVGVLSSSRATGGQGQTVSSAYGNAESRKVALVTVDSRANSAKWYMAPGNAVAGGEAIGTGGHVGLDTDVRARADLGTATSGVLNVARSNGVQPTWIDLVPGGVGGSTQAGQNPMPSIIYSITNNDPRADAGSAIGGTINIGTALDGKVRVCFCLGVRWGGDLEGRLLGFCVLRTGAYA